MVQRIVAVVSIGIYVSLIVTAVLLNPPSTFAPTADSSSEPRPQATLTMGGDIHASR